jgi:hypothetical protein
LVLPVLAYWYEGGRPSGAELGFIASEVVEAAAGLAGLAGGVELALAAVVFGAEESWDEVALLARSDEVAVPLTAGEEAAAGACADRLVVLLLEAATDVLLLLRFEPTRRLKRNDDISGKP